MIEVIGNCYLSHTNNRHARKPGEIVSAAAHVFSDWPNHFFELLEVLSRRKQNAHYDVRAQFSPLYNSFLKAKHHPDDTQWDFVRLALLNFVNNHQQIRAADPRLLRRLQNQLATRYVPRSTFSTYVGIDPRTVRRSLLTHPENGSVQRFAAIDTEGFSPSEGDKRVLPIRAAAQRLCVPVSVFQRLVDQHVYVARHRMPGQIGYDERDLRTLEARIVTPAVALVCGEHNHCHVPFRNVMADRRYSVDEKTAFIAALIGGHLPSFRPSGFSKTAELQIPSAAIDEFITTGRNADAIMNATAVISALHCAPETIPILIDLGLLTGNRASGGIWSIERRSVENFRSTYRKLSESAVELQTSSRRLMRICRENEIPLVLARVNERRQEVFIAAGSMPNIAEYDWKSKCCIENK